MKLDHDFFHVIKLSEDQKQKSSPKNEEFLSPNFSKDQKKSSPRNEKFLSPNSSEDKKKALHREPRSEEFLFPILSEDQKNVQTSSSAQMQTLVKLLGGCRCRP